MANRRFQKVNAWKEDDSIQIEFRLIPKSVSQEDDDEERKAAQKHQVCEEEEEVDDSADKQTNNLETNQRTQSSTSARTRLKEKARQQKRYLKQMFRGSSSTSAATTPATFDTKAGLEKLSDQYPPLGNDIKSDRPAKMASPPPPSVKSRRSYHSGCDTNIRTQNDLNLDANTFDRLNAINFLRKDRRSISSEPSGRREQSKPTRGTLDQIPLQHKRALLGLPLKTPNVLLGKESLKGTTNALEQFDDEDASATSGATSGGSILGTKVHGKVLVLQEQSGGGEAVEAVSLAEKRTLNNSEEANYISYTERLLQDDADDHGSEESCGPIDEAQACENGSVDLTGQCDDNTCDDNTTVAGTPLFVNTSGEISNLNLGESFDGARSVLGERDRYSVLDNAALRTTSGPALPSRRSPSLKVVRSTSCCTGPVPLDELEDLTRDDCNEFGSTEDFADAETSCSSRASRDTPYADLIQQASINTCVSTAPLVHYGLMQEPNSLRTGNMSSLPGRDCSNISATSVFSEEDSFYSHSLKAQYSSFDLESVGGSVATGVIKPLNIPVTQEFKDMAEELSKNPVLLMKWLNPL